MEEHYMSIVEIKQFVIDSSNPSQMEGGHHTITVAQRNGKSFALKEVAGNEAAEEAIKYALLKRLGVPTPNQVDVVYDATDKQNIKYYIATEIMPGYIPLGRLGMGSGLSNFRVFNGNFCAQVYSNWANACGLAKDESVFNLYKSFGKEDRNLTICGLNTLFAASVFIDDAVPCGTVGLSRTKGTPFWCSMNAGCAENAAEQVKKESNVRAKMFGNILLKLCRDKNDGQVYFQACKIDPDGCFKIARDFQFLYHERMINNMEKIFMNPKIIKENYEFQSDCSALSENICELYRPIVDASNISSLENRIFGAQTIAALTKDDINNIVDKDFTKPLPGDLAPLLTSERRQDIIDHIQGKVERFAQYAQHLSDMLDKRLKVQLIPGHIYCAF